MRDIFRPASHLYQATPLGTMGSLFVKDEVEQGTVHGQTAIAVNTDQLTELFMRKLWRDRVVSTSCQKPLRRR
jgi:hypothetical protein